MGASVDVDHFLAAGSLSLAEATALPRRPLTHSLTLGLVLVVASELWLGRWGLAVSLPYLQHLLRDGMRRGLWLWPLGHTPPLTLAVYLSTVALAPLLTRSLSCAPERVVVADPLSGERKV